MKQRLFPIGLSAAIVLQFIAFFSVTPDDSYITIRYGQLFAKGHGFVYNPGHHVEGISSLSFGLLSGIASLLRLPEIVVLKLAGLACLVGVVLVVRALLRDLGKPQLADGASLFLAFSPLVGLWALSGLETTFFVLAGLMTLRASQQRNLVHAAIWASLLSFTRIEGIAFAAVFLLPWFAAGFKSYLKAAVAPVAVAAAVEVFRIAFYGSLLPNSYINKAGPVDRPQIARGLHYVTQQLLSPIYNTAEVYRIKDVLLGGVAAIAMLAAAVLALKLLRAKQWVPLTLLLAVGLNLVMTIAGGGDWMPGSRLVQISWPILLILGCLVPWSKAIKPLANGSSARWVAGGLAVIALASQWSDVGKHQNAEQAGPFGLKELTWSEPSRIAPPWSGYDDVREWLAPRRAQLPLIAIEEAGYLSTTAVSQEFFDIYGLSDKHLAKAPGTPPFGRYDKSYILGRNADAFLLNVFYRTDGRVLQAAHYQLATDKDFLAKYTACVGLPDKDRGDFLIYVRNDKVAAMGCDAAMPEKAIEILFRYYDPTKRAKAPVVSDQR